LQLREGVFRVQSAIRERAKPPEASAESTLEGDGDAYFARRLRAGQAGRHPWVAFCCALLLLTGSALFAASSIAQRGSVPAFDHVLVVMMENHGYGQIFGSSKTPYIHHLAKHGAKFTDSHGITHPSQPNYLALFSGSTQGVHNDSCPHSFDTENLGDQLIMGGLTFSGYSEALPHQGSQVCDAGRYARRHVPWTNFTNVPQDDNRTYDQLPTDYADLPSVAFVIPNLCHDMHNCGPQAGDRWLKANIAPYADWAAAHNSLLVLTWDEDDGTRANHIPTVFAGANLKPGTYHERISHYSVLRTIESSFGLGAVGHAAGADPITDVWQ
jgi:phosphatidylinositol-3-phosphatase